MLLLYKAVISNAVSYVPKVLRKEAAVRALGAVRNLLCYTWVKVLLCSYLAAPERFLGKINCKSCN